MGVFFFFFFFFLGGGGGTGNYFSYWCMTEIACLHTFLRVRRFMVMDPFFFKQIRIVPENIFSIIKNNFHLISIAMFYA